MKLSGVFHLPKTFGNFHGKVHRVKNVFYLTQVAFVYDLVTKIQDGATDIAVNNLKLVILSENGTCLFTTKFQQKNRNAFSKFHLFRKLSSGTLGKRVFH